MVDNDRQVEEFDRQLGALHGLPGVLQTRQATVRHVGLTESSTFIVQTVRQRDEDRPARDTIFLEYVGSGGKAFRLVLPPGVAEVLARQRDQLAAVGRRKAARQAAQTRKDRGIEPGFLKGTRKK